MHFNQTTQVDFVNLKNNQLELWSYVLGFNAELDKLFCSPFRTDRNPGCRLSVVGEYVRLSDYADPYRHQKNVFQIVQHERNCTFEEALVFLSKKVKLTNTQSENNILKKYNQQFLIKSHPFLNKEGKIAFTEEHALYWYQYGVTTQQLLTDYVFPIKAFQLGKGGYHNIIIPKDITFSYYFKSAKHQKIYRPKQQSPYKWTTNCDEQDIWFWSQQDFGKDYLIVTKSYKDARILKNLGYNVIAVQSESSYLPDNHVKYLERKYSKIFVLFDNDEEGVNWVLKHQEKYNNATNTLKFIPTWYDISLPKDTGDIYSLLGKETVLHELKNMI